jgi:hypothetical protein
VVGQTRETFRWIHRLETKMVERDRRSLVAARGDQVAAQMGLSGSS